MPTEHWTNLWHSSTRRLTSINGHAKLVQIQAHSAARKEPLLITKGRTFCWYGPTGSGKTTQGGEFAKWLFKTKRKRTVLNSSDRGGYESLKPLIKLGVIIVNELKQTDDPWMWINAKSEPDVNPDEIGLIIHDGGTSESEALLTAAHKSAFQIGQQKTQKFAVTRGAESLNVSINNEAHYGVVQGFMLDQIWRSTWMTDKGIDVVWTFGEFRGEEQDRTPILGPKLAGKALTASVPRWFNYTFRFDSEPQDNASPLHVMHLTEATEMAGLGHSFGNARYPMGATTSLPPKIEPASIVSALELIEQGHREAEESLAAELGL